MKSNTSRSKTNLKPKTPQRRDMSRRNSIEFREQQARIREFEENIRNEVETEIRLGVRSEYTQIGRSGGRTGVFEEDESFLVEYQGVVIAYVLNASEGWSILESRQNQK